MNKLKNTVYQKNFPYSSDAFQVLIQKRTTSQQEDAFHEAIEIKYFYEGRSIISIGSELIVAEPGDIVIANPFEVHSSIVHDGYVGKYYILMMDLDFFADHGMEGIDLRQQLLVKGCRLNHLIRGNERLQQLILRADEELTEQKPYYQVAVQGILCELFSLLLREELQAERLPNWSQSTINHSLTILPALQKIFCDYQKRLTVDELAQLCNISKYHFCRIFKEQMGVTVIQYLINYRVSLAELMLNTKSYSISEIAALCGFEDISYFYRCYKRIKGTSPNKGRST